MIKPCMSVLSGTLPKSTSDSDHANEIWLNNLIANVSFER